MEPRAQPGYYPKLSTLSQQAYWDAATREVVLRRLNVVPLVRFFTWEEAEIMQRVIEHVLPQDDRTPERRIPILPLIDERLFIGRTAGWIYETDSKHDFARGFAIQTVGPLPVAFAKQMLDAKGAWGWGLRRTMMDYNHWCALGLLGKILPWKDNCVTISSTDKDQFGLPVARVTFNLHDNDHKLIEFGEGMVMDVMRAAGADEVVQEPRYAHLVGAARMGKDPATSVVDEFGRTHDIANLFVCDGSVMPTQGSANPGLTIQAPAARTADYLISQGTAIFNSHHRDRTSPPVRRDLSPPGTHRAGVPRLG